MEQEKNNELPAPPKGRLILGGVVFISGFLSPLLIPWVLTLEISTGMISLISGLLAFGIPELFMLIAVGILGKEGFKYLKTKIFGLLKKYGPPDTVSLLRYRIGLVFFLIPIISGFVIPYVLEIIPFVKKNLLIIVISGDVMLLISLFILGGDFWDKIRSLFIFKSRAVLMNDRSQKTNQHD